jgi:iron complex transport system ATP-binding protein
MPTWAPPPSVAIEARNVSAVLGGFTVLSDASLSVRAGELVALVGPNGAGKSTLLNVLAGDIPSATGEVVVDGEPLAEWSASELALRRAVLPQQVTVRFPFLVEEVVAMGRAPWARTPFTAEDDARISASRAAADVRYLVGRSFTTLSGGERARVTLARVLAQHSQVILLDEPTAALDIHHQELILQVVRQCTAEGACAIVVLHDLALAAAHADRIAVLAGGRIVADGPLREVLKADLLSDVYHHPIEVIPHPRSGLPLVLPQRAP